MITTNKVDKVIVGAWLAVVVFNLVAWGLGIYVVAHFLLKVW